jgi:FAD/FMN-containing dehydrogenase
VYAAGYPTDAAAVLLVEVDGASEALVSEEAETVETILREAGATSIRSATDPAQRERLWQGRKKAFGALGRISRDLVVQDAVVPRTTLPDVLEGIAAIAEHYGLVVSNVFHAGDGNLHPNLNFDSRDPSAVARVEAASAEIMALCISAGGTITGEHGVGVDKLQYMHDIFDPTTLSAMDRVRRAFDPERHANPCKVIPLRSCREWHGFVGRRA